MGIGTQIDINQAILYYEKSLQLGHKEVTKILAKLYIQQNDVKKGFEYLKKATNEGDDESTMMSFVYK